MYKLRISYGPWNLVMHTATRFRDTGTGVNIISFSMIPTEWWNWTIRKKLPTLHTATKEPLQLNGLIPLELLHTNLNTQFWFGIATNLAVDVLLGTILWTLLNEVYFPPKKVGPLHSQSVALPSGKVKRIDKATNGNPEEDWTTNTQQPVEGLKHGLAWVARQTVLKPFTHHPVIVTTISNGILKTKLEQLATIYFVVPALDVVVEAPPQ